MKKRLLSLALTMLMVATLIPLGAVEVPQALGASVDLPTNVGSTAGTLHTWTVGNTPVLTAEMLRTANRLEVYTNASNTSFNFGGQPPAARGISVYAQGAGTGWWDDTHITEIGQNPSGRYTFDLEWKRDVWGATPGNDCGIALGCAWWQNPWTTLRGQITRVALVYGEPLRNTPVNDIGTPLLGSSNPNAGDVNGDGAVNAADTTMLRRYIAAGNNAAGLNNFQLANADVNGDGVINSLDVTKLRQHIAATDPSTVPLGGTGSGVVPLADRPIQANAKWYIALTIDDGPVMGPSTTGATAVILESLANAKAPDGTSARATWFVCGRRLTQQNVPLIERIAALGHDVENHTWGHGNVTAVPCQEREEWVGNDLVSSPCPCGNPTGRHWVDGRDQGVANVRGYSATMFNREITATSDRIEDILGRRPKYFRFPQFEGGSHGPAVNAAGMSVIHAQADLQDFQAAQNVASLRNRMRNGGSIDGMTYSNIDIGGWDGVIMLFHDAGGDAGSNMYTQNNAQVFADAVPYLQGLGYAFVTLEELFAIRGMTPASGSGGPRFNGHFGNENWNLWDSGLVSGRLQACAPGVACNNTRCP
jgi:peptidoglycan/xylan/chitin deacetylase (PgdA/CDA1 family)